MQQSAAIGKQADQKRKGRQHRIDNPEQDEVDQRRHEINRLAVVTADGQTHGPHAERGLTRPAERQAEIEPGDDEEQRRKNEEAKPKRRTKKAEAETPAES